MKYSFILIVLFVLRDGLSVIDVTTPAFFFLLFAWYFFFHSFMSNLSVVLCFSCVSCVTWLDLNLPSYYVVYALIIVPFSLLFCHLDEMAILSFRFPPHFYLEIMTSFTSYPRNYCTNLIKSNVN